MNSVSQESGRSYIFVQGIGQKDILQIPNALSIKSLSVARSCSPTKADIEEWRHLDGVNIPQLENPEVALFNRN